MGVTHKLSEEVVGFITAQKQANPRLSCRSLVTVVTERFQIHVSKSSINAVLKEAQLSSSVGRRASGEAPPRKFKIPAEKKIQNLISAPKVFPAPSEVKEDKPVKKVPAPVKLPPPPPPPAVFPKAEPVPAPPRERKIKEIPVEHKPAPFLADPLPPRVLSIKRPVNRGVLFDGMGNFFLKAAAWDLSSSSILGGFVSKYVPANMASNINAVSEVFQYLEAFGIKKLEDIHQYKGQGLWALNGMNHPLDYQSLAVISNSISDLKGLSLKISSESPLIFSEITCIRMWLEDRTELTFDAQLNTLWSKNVQSCFSSPIEKVLSAVSSNFINNVHSIILRSIPGQNGFIRQIYDLMAAFEGISGKKIEKIAIFDKNNEEIAKFTIIPNKKRFFIVGAWPWQKEFGNLLADDTGNIEAFYQEELGQEVFYSEFRTDLAQAYFEEKLPAVRVFLLRESSTGDPISAVLTNIEEDRMSAQEAVSAYLLRWPNLQKGHLEFINPAEGGMADVTSSPLISPDSSLSFREDDPYAFLSEAPDIFAQSRVLLAELHKYCQRHFFLPQYEKADFPTVRARFYGLSGYLRRVQDSLVVHLVVPEGYLYRKDLEYAVRRLNEGNIRNNLGGKLVMGIEPFA